MKSAAITFVTIVATAFSAVRFHDTGDGVFLWFAVAGALGVIAGGLQDVVDAIGDRKGCDCAWCERNRTRSQHPGPTP